MTAVGFNEWLPLHAFTVVLTHPPRLEGTGTAGDKDGLTVGSSKKLGS